MKGAMLRVALFSSNRKSHGTPFLTGVAVISHAPPEPARASEAARDRSADSPVRAAVRKTLEHVSLRLPGAVDLLRPEGGELALRRAARRSTLARVDAQPGAVALVELVAGSRGGVEHAVELDVGRAAELGVADAAEIGDAVVSLVYVHLHAVVVRAGAKALVAVGSAELHPARDIDAERRDAVIKGGVGRRSDDIPEPCGGRFTGAVASALWIAAGDTPDAWNDRRSARDAQIGNGELEDPGAVVIARDDGNRRDLGIGRGAVLAAAVVEADAEAELPGVRGERALRKGEQAEREQLSLHSFCSPSALSAHGSLGLLGPFGLLRTQWPLRPLRAGIFRALLTSRLSSFLGTHDFAQLEAH